jgi:RNA polymerase sigma-32 factor
MRPEQETIQLYVQSIREIPMLSAAEERKLAHAYRQNGDDGAAHRLVEANLRFVVLLARRYARSGGRMADLIQEGNIGLMHAVRRFDPDKGVRLVSYASLWIRASMREYLLRTTSLVRAKGSDATLSGPGDVSLDAPVEDGGVSVEELATDEEASAEVGLARAQEEAALRRRVLEGLARLDKRERFLAERLMDDAPMSLRDLGVRFGCSPQRVQQIKIRARRKLRDHLLTSEVGPS